MTKKVKIFAGVLIVVFIAAGIFISCSDDIVLEPLPSLLGEYEGRYLVTEDIGTTSQRTHEYEIRWRFSDQKYWMFDDLDQGVCTPSGDYTLTGEVELNQLTLGQVALCNESFTPIGIFSLRQPGDSVILTQQVDDMKKEMLLLRVE